jgi:outer membrane protein insertion porin family
MSVVRRPRSHANLLLLAAGLLGGFARPGSAAVPDYVGRPVIQVRLEVEGVELVEPAVTDLVETRVGQPLSMAQVRETVGHLFGLGRYEDVQVHASLLDNGVGLVYALVPVRRVLGLEFRGRLELSESLVRATVTDRLGPTPAIGRAAEAVRLLEDLYHEHGYRHPMIVFRSITENKPAGTRLVFDVNPGARPLVRMVTVEGAGPITREALLDRINLRANAPFEPVALVTSLGRYRAELQAKGYYEARVNYLQRVAADELTVDLTIIVETGPVVTVRFEGDPLPERERDALVPIAREQSVDEDLLEDSKRRIERRLRDEGYREARADYTRVESGGTLTVVFTVTRGPQHRLAVMEVAGNRSVPPAQLRALVRLKEGEPFVDSTFLADVAGMADVYRRQGFAGVKIDPTVSASDRPATSERLVTARVSISEGVQSVIREVTFTGNQALNESTLRGVARVTAGQPFYEPQTEAATDGLALEYLNRGYPNAAVERAITYTEDRRGVDVAFRIQEGVQVLVDHILLVGNSRTASDVIERELVFKAGEPLGQEAIVESQRRLGALGLFRRIEITQLRHPGEEGRRDVLVTVEEAPATTIAWGGGLEGGKRLQLQRFIDGTSSAVERFEFAPHGFFQIGRRNLWGKNRSIELLARVSFRSRGEGSALPASPPSETSTGRGFNEYRLSLNYREPKVFRLPADGLVSGYLEQGIRSSFNFSRRGTRLEMVRRLTPVTSLSGRYLLEQTRLFDEKPNPEDQLAIDRLFPEVRLSSVSSSIVRSTRDDPIEPSRGALVTLDGSLAARALGSQVGFVKTLLKGFIYRQITDSRRAVFAGGATLGLAHGFPHEVPVPGGGGSETIQDLPASERFYAGGDTTVRGFALDRLGTRTPPATIDDDGFPKGGHALVIFNAELRVPVWKAFGAVGFLDVGNVFANVIDVNVAEFRGAVGFGLRYRSPVGPIRVDLGFKLSRFDFPSGKEPLTALHISLGQAF